MKSAILIHGMPSRQEYEESKIPMSEKHWFGWLTKELISNGVKTTSLDMPEPYQPDYEKWKEVFEKNSIGPDTVLVGHSCGGGFIVRWLSESKVKVGKVALVAPWIDPKDHRPKPGFFDFQVDEGLAERSGGMMLFISSDDDKSELDTAELLKREIKGIQTMEFSNKGHFTLSDMGTQEFPELKEFILK